VIKNVKDESHWESLTDLFLESTKSLQSVVEYYTRYNATPQAHGIKDLINEQHFIDMVKRMDPKNSLFRSVVEEAVDSFVAVQSAKDKGFSESMLKTIEKVATELGVEYKVSKAPFYKAAGFANYEMFKLFEYGVRVNKNHIDVLERYINSVDGI